MNESLNSLTLLASYESLTAVAKATMLGAFKVPLRISRSCPPPCSNAGISKARRKIRAPIPSGPPIL